MFQLIRRSLSLMLLFVLTALPTLAQEAGVQGRVVSQADWLERMPIIIAVVVITILIDVVFIVAFRRRDGK